MTPENFEELGFFILAQDTTYLVASNKSELKYWTELGYDIEKQIVQVMGAYQHEKGGIVRLTLYTGECKDSTDLKKILKFIEHY